MSAPLNNDNMIQAEDARQGVMTFVMYFYNALREQGFSDKDAKARAADMLEDAYHQYCSAGSITPKPLGSAQARLNKVKEQIKEQAKTNPALRDVYTDLVSIEAQITGRR